MIENDLEGLASGLWPLASGPLFAGTAGNAERKLLSTMDLVLKVLGACDHNNSAVGLARSINTSTGGGGGGGAGGGGGGGG